MTILDKLKNYFETTPREQIEKDWKDCSKYDNVGPKVDDFIKAQQEKSLEINQSFVDSKSDDELEDIMKEFDKINPNNEQE